MTSRLYGRARVLQSDPEAQEAPFQPDYESPAGTGGYDTATAFSPTQQVPGNPGLTTMPGGFQPAVTRASAGFGVRRGFGGGFNRPPGFGGMQPPPTGGPNMPPVAPSFSPQSPGGYLSDELSRSRGIADASYADYEAGRSAWGSRINDVGNFSPTETQGVAAPNLSQYGDELSSFDPGATYDKYLTAAQGKFKMNLSDALMAEQDRGAATGRLNTGWLDVNKGKIGERLATDFASDAGDRALSAAQASGAYRLNTANTRGDLAARGTSLALQRAGAIDTSRQRAGEFAASQSGAMAQNAGEYATRTREYGADVASGMMDREQARKNAERESNANQWQTGIDAAGTIADIASRFWKGGRGAADGTGGGGGMSGAVGAAGKMLGRIPGVGTAARFIGTKALPAAAGGYAGYKYAAPMAGKAGDWAGARTGVRGIGRAASEIGRGASIGAAAGSIVPGIGTVVGGAVGAGIGAAASAGRAVKRAGNWVKGRLSDLRVKSDVTPIGMYGPLKLYRYRIDGRSEIGVLAHEARAALPQSVAIGHDGFYRVDYAMLVRAFGVR